MTLKNRIIGLSITCLLSTGSVLAQDSMLPDFNYVYLEKLVAVAKENYPRSKNFDTRIKIAKLAVNSSKASWLEPFSFSYFGRSNDGAIDIVNPALLTGYQLGLSVNPGSLLQKPFAVKTAKEQVKIAENDKLEYALTLETEVKTRYIAYVQAVNDLKLQSKITLDGEAIYNSMRYKYEKGEITFLEYNTASQGRNTAIQAKLIAEGRVLATKISLEELTVLKLESIK